MSPLKETDWPRTPKDSETKFGVINEDDFQLRGDECNTLAEAMKQAAEMIEEGSEQVAIVMCQYSARHEAWVEVPGKRLTINVDGDWTPEE